MGEARTDQKQGARSKREAGCSLICDVVPWSRLMKFVNVREFKMRASAYLRAGEEIVITRYGKPIARVLPETEETIVDALRAMGQILRDAGVTKKEALAALQRARRKLYGPKRRKAPVR